jgi:hypothetical protein
VFIVIPEAAIRVNGGIVRAVQGNVEWETVLPSGDQVQEPAPGRIKLVGELARLPLFAKPVEQGESQLLQRD